jgi:hypothetical protein
VIDLVLVLGVAIAVGAVGLGIGMLIAGRLGRWLDRADEEPDDR